MGSVLGFESGLIDISVRNAVRSTLRLIIPKTANVAIVDGTSDAITKIITINKKNFGFF
jgi:hypothetical protein